ncbi:endoribonuclease YicC domain-containing protein, partial [uncultured Duncaniella sp.]
LGFITQEIGREINTLGSKSNHSDMQRLVVQMKDELEQMKEQVLNVL